MREGVRLDPAVGLALSRLRPVLDLLMKWGREGGMPMWLTSYGRFRGDVSDRLANRSLRLSAWLPALAMCMMHRKGVEVCR